MKLVNQHGVDDIKQTHYDFNIFEVLKTQFSSFIIGKLSPTNCNISGITYFNKNPLSF